MRMRGSFLLAFSDLRYTSDGPDEGARLAEPAWVLLITPDSSPPAITPDSSPPAITPDSSPPAGMNLGALWAYLCIFVVRYGPPPSLQPLDG
jgi:hypothetical protein